MKATEVGQVECMKMLLDRGAEVNMQNEVCGHYTLCTCNAECTQRSPQ